MIFFFSHDSNDSEFSSRRIECFISFNWFEKLLKVSCPTIDKTRSGETGERWMICKGNEDGNNGGGSRYRFALAVALTLRGAWFIELNRVRVSLIRRVVSLSDKSTSSPPFFFAFSFPFSLLSLSYSQKTNWADMPVSCVCFPIQTAWLAVSLFLSQPIVCEDTNNKLGRNASMKVTINKPVVMQFRCRLLRFIIQYGSSWPEGVSLHRCQISISLCTFPFSLLTSPFHLLPLSSCRGSNCWCLFT